MRFIPYAFGLAATALLGSSMLCAPSFAAAPAPAASTAPAQPTDPNTVVATVNGEKITVADVQNAMGTMPPQMRQLPTTLIYPMLVNQLADQKAILIAAQKEG